MPFVKGQVLKHKRSGRPKGFRGVAKQIMRATKDGRELVEFALATFRDEDRAHHVRWEAMCWLANRGLGLPLATIELDAAIATNEPAPRLDVEKLSHAQRADLRALILRAAGKPREVGQTATGNVIRLVDGDAPADAIDAESSDE